MKKTLTLTVLFCLLTVPLTFAFFDTPVDKAKDFMDAGMYQQALETLNKHIMEEPKDAEAHYYMGLCYVQMGKYGKAEERFKSAVRLDPEYKAKIGRGYKQVGLDALIEGDTRKAQRLFERAVQHQPNLKPGIAKQLFNRGKLGMAIQFDPSLRPQVCKTLLDQADKASDEECLSLYKNAAQYCDKNSEESKKAGERLLAISKHLNGKKYEKYREAAGMYMEVPADYKVYRIGNILETPLEAGEVLDHHIRIEGDVKVRIAAGWNEDQYELWPRNGRPVKVWSGDGLPETLNDFRVFAKKKIYFMMKLDPGKK